MSAATSVLGDYLLPVRSITPYAELGECEFTYLDISSVDRGSKRITEPQVLSTREAPSRARQVVASGDVLISTVRPNLNTVALVDAAHSNAIASTGFCVLRSDGRHLDRRFLFHWISSETTVKTLANLATGASYPAVSDKIIKSLPIRLPSLDGQRHIATILDKAENLRRKRQEVIQLTDVFLRAVFLNMFGDPVTNPKEWPLKRFGELGEWASGGTPSRSKREFFEGDIPWFSAGELNEMYISRSAEKVTEVALKSSAAKLFPAGSILLGMYDTAAFKASILAVDASSNQACANFKPGSLVTPEWFYYLAQIGKEHYLKHRRGVRQKNLNLGMIKEFELSCPPRALQDEFSRIVGQVRKILARQESSLKQVSELAAALHSEMLEGDVWRADKEWIRNEVVA